MGDRRFSWSTTLKDRGCDFLFFRDEILVVKRGILGRVLEPSCSDYAVQNAFGACLPTSG